MYKRQYFTYSLGTTSPWLTEPALASTRVSSLTTELAATPSLALTAAPPPSPAAADNTGAIVGGVVGGVAALALVAGVLVYRSRANEKRALTRSKMARATREAEELEQARRRRSSVRSAFQNSRRASQYSTSGRRASEAPIARKSSFVGTVGEMMGLNGRRDSGGSGPSTTSNATQTGATATANVEVDPFTIADPSGGTAAGIRRKSSLRLSIAHAIAGNSSSGGSVSGASPSGGGGVAVGMHSSDLPPTGASPARTGSIGRRASFRQAVASVIAGADVSASADVSVPRAEPDDVPFAVTNPMETTPTSAAGASSTRGLGHQSSSGSVESMGMGGDDSIIQRSGSFRRSIVRTLSKGAESAVPAILRTKSQDGSSALGAAQQQPPKSILRTPSRGAGSSSTVGGGGAPPTHALSPVTDVPEEEPYQPPSPKAPVLPDAQKEGFAPYFGETPPIRRTQSGHFRAQTRVPVLYNPVFAAPYVAHPPPGRPSGVSGTPTAPPPTSSSSPASASGAAAASAAASSNGESDWL